MSRAAGEFAGEWAAATPWLEAAGEDPWHHAAADLVRTLLMGRRDETGEVGRQWLRHKTLYMWDLAEPWAFRADWMAGEVRRREQRRLTLLCGCQRAPVPRGPLQPCARCDMDARWTARKEMGRFIEALLRWHQR